MTLRFARSPIAFGALVLFTTFAVGCGSATDSTNSQQSTYFIRFKANGTQYEYHDVIANPVVASFAKVGPEYSFIASGVSASGVTSGGGITLNAFDVSPITTKTYGAFQGAGTGYTVGQILFQLGTGSYDNTDPNSDVRVTLTQITATEARGVFSGTVTSASHGSVVITNGEFFAKRIS